MKLIKSLSVYTTTNILNSGISFFLLPIFTFYLSPKDYGILSMFNITVSLLLPVIGIAVYSAISIEYFKLEKKEFPIYVSSSLINPIISFVILSLLFWLFSDVIHELTKIPHLWIPFVPLLAFLQIIPKVILSIFQVMKKPFRYAYFNLGSALMNVSMGLILVVGLKLNWEGRGYSLFLTYFVFTCIGLFILGRLGFLTPFRNKAFQKDALNYGVPLIPHLMGAFVIDYSDRFFIAQMIDIEAVGIYNIGYQIGFIIAILQASIVQAYQPFLFENLKIGSEDKKYEIVKYSYFLMAALLFFAILLILAAPIIFKYLIHEKFNDGLVYVFWIVLGYFFLGVYKMVVGFIFFKKKTKTLTILSILTISLNLILNYFLILNYGAIGAAYATTLSYLIVLILCFFISNLYFPMPWFSLKKVFSK